MAEVISIDFSSKFNSYTNYTVVKMCENITKLINVLENKLAPVFDDLDKEADEVRKKSKKERIKSSYVDNDNWEEEAYKHYEIEMEAEEEGWNYYSINKEIQQDFLNMTIVWLFHLFEKEKKNIFTFKIEEIKGKEEIEFEGVNLKELLKKIGVLTEEDSNWFKINKELRVLNNAIKHGEGDAFDKLKKLRPDLIDKDENNQERIKLPFEENEEKIKVTFEEVKKYAKTMKEFWKEYFLKTETYCNPRDGKDNNYLINRDHTSGDCD